jgi:hypothetical protein
MNNDDDVGMIINHSCNPLQVMRIELILAVTEVRADQTHTMTCSNYVAVFFLNKNNTCKTHASMSNNHSGNPLQHMQMK